MTYFVSKDGKKAVTREKENGEDRGGGGEHSSKGGRNWGRVDAWKYSVGEKEVGTGREGCGNGERWEWKHGSKGWKLLEKWGGGGVGYKEVGTSKEKKEARRGDNLERRRWELRGK